MFRNSQEKHYTLLPGGLPMAYVSYLSQVKEKKHNLYICMLLADKLLKKSLNSWGWMLKRPPGTAFVNGLLCILTPEAMIWCTLPWQKRLMIRGVASWGLLGCPWLPPPLGRPSFEQKTYKTDEQSEWNSFILWNLTAGYKLFCRLVLPTTLIAHPKTVTLSKTCTAWRSTWQSVE